MPLKGENKIELNLGMAYGKDRSIQFLEVIELWGKQGGKIVLKVKTQKEKLLRAIREFEIWIKLNRNKHKLKELWALAKSKVLGQM